MADLFPRRILVPIDVTDHHPQALELAITMASASGAEIVVLSVADDRFPYPDIMSFQEPHEGYYKMFRERALEILREATASAPEKINIRPVVTRGRPARVIVDVAKEEGADLVVMTTHGSHGLEHAILGSVTDRVLRLSTVPVLVVPHRPR